MSNEWKPEVDFQPWGPFIGKNYKQELITKTDVIIASVVWGATLFNVILAVYLGWKQSKNSRSPLRSVYIWMIWIELGVCFLMGLECYLHILKYIKPSFAFYMTILTWWCIQVQLLLQIIINRIRIIVPDRQFSGKIMVWTAVVVTAINISVFNIWIPARCQINDTYVSINNIWDRIEKVVYLFIDAALNWYFLKVVKANLINNGLQKYNKLLRFNQRIIIVSLLMDVMIIAAMSIPNTFIYIQFHPLAYLVKLNIEMTMANLIKRIAVSTLRRAGNQARVAKEFGSSNLSTSGAKSRGTIHASNFIELSNGIFHKEPADKDKEGHVVSLQALGDQHITVTKDIQIRSDPNPDHIGSKIYAGSSPPDKYSELNSDGQKPHALAVVATKSVDDLTEGGSVRSDVRQSKGDSDDEELLGMPDKKGTWHRLDG